MNAPWQAPVSKEEFRAWVDHVYGLFLYIQQENGAVLGFTRDDILPDVEVLFAGDPDNLCETMDLCGLYDRRKKQFRFADHVLSSVVEGLDKTELSDQAGQGLLDLVKGYVQNAVKNEGYPTHPWDVQYEEKEQTVQAGLKEMIGYAGVLAAAGKEAELQELRGLAIKMRYFWQDCLYAVYQKAGKKLERQYLEEFDKAAASARASGQASAFDSANASAIIRGLFVHAEEQRVENENLPAYWRCRDLAERLQSEYREAVSFLPDDADLAADHPTDKTTEEMGGMQL